MNHQDRTEFSLGLQNLWFFTSGELVSIDQLQQVGAGDDGHNDVPEEVDELDVGLDMEINDRNVHIVAAQLFQQLAEVVDELNELRHHEDQRQAMIAVEEQLHAAMQQPPLKNPRIIVVRVPGGYFEDGRALLEPGIVEEHEDVDNDEGAPMLHIELAKDPRD